MAKFQSCSNSKSNFKPTPKSVPKSNSKFVSNSAPKSLAMLVALKLGLLVVMPMAVADEVYDRCMKQANATTMTYATCGSDWLKREDGKLNAAWKRVFAQAQGQTRTDLLDEQRAWVAFKEKACGFYANGDWGTDGRAIQYPVCQAAVIAERTRDIEAIGGFLAP